VPTCQEAARCTSCRCCLHRGLPFSRAVSSLLGTFDLLQTRHAVLRKYPITAHLRFMLEKIRPEMRQYFFEDEKQGMPFSRDKRAVVYQRAKKVLDKRPFGTQYDVYADGYEWLRHSIAPRPVPRKHFGSRSVVPNAPGPIPRRCSIFRR
jgi:glutamate synthase domain-containing protein 2